MLLDDGCRCVAPEVIGINMEGKKADSSLTTPKLCPKEPPRGSPSLFGDPE